MYSVTQEMCHDVANKLATKPIAMLFPEAISRVAEGMCSSCNKPVRYFSNDLSVREFYISGLCEVCQDGVFNTLGSKGNPK